jgi:hypothetical protein
LAITLLKINTFEKKPLGFQPFEKKVSLYYKNTYPVIDEKLIEGCRKKTT